MEYLPRPGVVRASLCGMYVLIPSRIASNYCKKILPMSMAETMIWAGIEKGYPIEKTLERLRIFSKKTDQELIDRINRFSNKLYEQGFVIRKEE